MGNVTWGVQKTWTHAALMALARHYRGPIAVDFGHAGNCVLMSVRLGRSIADGETLERACEAAIQCLTDAEVLAATFPDHDGDTQPNNERPEPQKCDHVAFSVDGKRSVTCQRELGHEGPHYAGPTARIES